MKKILLYAALISVVSTALFVGLSQNTALAVDPLEGVCSSNPDASACKRSSTDPISGKDGIIIKVTKVVSLVTGVAAVVVIIIAGVQVVMSGGESNKIASARRMILYAIIGLVAALVAQAIISFVLKKL